MVMFAVDINGLFLKVRDQTEYGTKGKTKGANYKDL